MSEMRKGMAVAMGAAATRATMTPVTFMFAVLVFCFFLGRCFLSKESEVTGDEAVLARCPAPANKRWGEMGSFKRASLLFRSMDERRTGDE